ncbi:hypothetical protein HWV62_42486 [Athelia sp. TMB]|nr:hypothetical protein HWV62_42486 [Athelia sp. TMB]
MSTTIIVPQGLGYTFASLIASSLVVTWQGMNVGKYRKIAKIPYPQAYAEKAEADASIDAKRFNCAQRAHQNTLENVTLMYTLWVTAPETQASVKGEVSDILVYWNMPKSSVRPSLPTSSTDFALPPSSSSIASPSAPISSDDGNPLLVRFRRPSILAPKAAYFSETRLQSPLVASFTLPSRRRNSVYGEESENERMWTDSSPSSSENPTPPLGPAIEVQPSPVKGKRRRNPSTPPRNSPPTSVEAAGGFTAGHRRRPSGPTKVRTPRILNLLQESRPGDDEVKSEAAFQRLIASGSDLPLQPRTPRAASDRGRFPEEAGHEEIHREDTPSDDESHGEDTFAFLQSSELLSTTKPCTPAGSVCGDELGMLISESPGPFQPMDIDVPMASPSLSHTPAIQWRHTPPPTTSAVRSNKRKLDDRFDPYPSSSKRRAVSPSVSSYFRDAHSSLRTPGTPRLSIPIGIPVNNAPSVAGSPTIGSMYATSIPRNGSIGHMSVSSSPTMRSSMSLASPVLRPMARVRRGDGEEREVEGAGEGVGGLTLE